MTKNNIIKQIVNEWYELDKNHWGSPRDLEQMISQLIIEAQFDKSIVEEAEAIYANSI